MKLNIRGEKTEITNSMKAYAEEKIGKLDKYIENSEDIIGTILFKVRGNVQKIEVTIPLNNYMLRVEEEGQDFYSVIDTSIDKLERQIVKNKSRIIDRKKKEKKESMDFVLDFDAEDENKDQIVKRKKVELKPMDEEEAILQMELTNHDFYMFKNIDTNKVSILYKRKHNDYGIIEEE